VCARCVWCVHVHGAPTVCTQPAGPCKTRCNRASPRLRQPPGLSRHDLDSPAKRAHSCNWSLRLKHDGSNWRARARRGFHVRTGCAHCVCAHGCACVCTTTPAAALRVHTHRPPAHTAGQKWPKSDQKLGKTWLRSPPGLSRHDLDSPAKCAHSCNWPLRLKLDGSNWRTRARRQFSAFWRGCQGAGASSRGVCVHQQHCTHRVCTHHGGAKSGRKVTKSSRNHGSRDLPSCPDTIWIALLSAQLIAIGHSG
jgi:hypothetical protein